jgi:hypothetical protein
MATITTFKCDLCGTETLDQNEGWCTISLTLPFYFSGDLCRECAAKLYHALAKDRPVRPD